MIHLADLIDAFLPDLEGRYGSRLLPGHRQALAAISRCRTEASGQARLHCFECEAQDRFALSCGHRACPRCQFRTGEQWLQRQRAKLLPCDYFLLTFTLPAQLRSLVFSHQRIAYDLLMKIAWRVLAGFGLNDRKLAGKLGATAVLHTHSRALGFHPHVHIVVPAGALDPKHRLWRTKKGRFLFPQKALAIVFRAQWLQAMTEQGWTVKSRLPDTWVVDCKRVGNGDKALTYLGRYLYRGVLREKDILSVQDNRVTFRYTDNTGTVRTRTLGGADFLWLLLQHVLPKGFRRTRDHGFLHGNAKRTIRLLQWLFRITIVPPEKATPLCCKHCGGTVRITILPYPGKQKPSLAGESVTEGIG